MAQKETATLFWIDYETFGANPALDRPCQFAGIRTDMDFNIIGEPLVIYCKPPSDYLPNPEACLITGITPQEAMEKGLLEPDFIKLIHNELSQPNTCVIGYNNVRFDDEVTRYTLYRNFYDAYAWAWKNNNSRWDLLDVMRACYALRPDGIEWPLKEDGTPSFKLEHLSKENGISHENAHDAMSDVYATIELAKLVRLHQPKLFDYFFEMRDKRKLEKLIDVVNLTPLMHVSGMLGNQCGNTSWMVPIAWHPTNKNAVICVNLAQDPTPLLTLNAEEIEQRLYTKRSDLEAGELPIPVKLIHLNKCPILAKAATLKPENAQRLNIDRDHCLQHLSMIKSNGDIREKLMRVFEKTRDFAENTNVDTKLYGGFFSAADRTAMDIIRETPPEQLEDLALHYDDSRIKALLFRYRARNYPFTLNESEQARWQHHCQDYFLENQETYTRALEQLFIDNQDNETNLRILTHVRQYVYE